MEYRGICDVGLQRTMNQDAVYMAAKDDIGIFCVADGMGGHSHGERASREIVDGIAHWWQNFQETAYDRDFSRMIYSLNQVLEKANRNIYQGSGREISGSTVVVLFIWHERYGILSAGDSRIYLCDRSRVKQLTVDEVWENQVNLHMSSRLKKQHPNRGKLVNAVGIEADVKITSCTDTVRAGMVFMLCSDGLYKMCSDRVIARALKDCRRGDLEDIAGGLLRKVYEGGAVDNTSVVLVRI